MEDASKDWKTLLHEGLLVTPYRHFTIVAEGVAAEAIPAYNCAAGTAYIGMKIWASSLEEAAEVFGTVVTDTNFNVTGEVQYYETEPLEAPGDRPSAYDIIFSPY